MLGSARTFVLAFLLLTALALLGAGGASATVLCKSATNPCTSSYGKGTGIALSLSGETVAIKTAMFKTACFAGAIEGEVTNAGGGGNVSGSVSKLSFTNCTGCGGLKAVETLKKGAFSVAYTSGGNGTLTLEGFEIQDPCSSCTFTGPTPLSLSGGAMASVAANSPLFKAKPNIFCNEENQLIGNFTVTAPEPLYVEPS